MNSRITKTVALAALMTGVAGGSAGAVEGWYGRADVGYSIDGSLDTEVNSGVTDAQFGDLEFEEDWMQSAGIGYSFGHLRLEGEVSHRFNSFDMPVNSGGDAHAWALMVNALYDFNPDGWFQPYLGLGVGAARVNINAVQPGVGSFDDSDGNLAYQALAGVAFALTERLDLDIGYRYFAAPDLNFEGIGSVATAATMEADYEHQAVTVGLRWQFAAPAAPPPPPPPVAAAPPPPVATCPQSDFVVYFEWDRSNLNQSALEVIDSAVARARECNISSATLVGHTDTSGAPAYNVELSERRASVVRDALVARGLASSLITAEARGEGDLARPTADGVREPLNRRTAVTIRFQ
jgi:outer membrane protein OmpA-like peptidoglycan-associated protein